VKAYIDRVLEEARQTGYVKTILNRRRPMQDLNSRNPTLRRFAERTAMNTPIQGSAADIIKMAMVRIHRRLNEQGMASRMVLQVHDELIFEAPKDEVEALCQLVRREMEGVYELRVPLKVDLKAGADWYHMLPCG
ncbi:MAG: DNA polymerase I, partial [Thermoleophilia bacterium]|nr:DNA polymerase I [Thermoleophilia bacterium]